MKALNVLKLAASTLVLGAGFVATAGMAGDQGRSESSAKSGLSRAAAASAQAARKALASNKAEKAVTLAERAVASMPNDPTYRQLLGESYLAAGRFMSAETSFQDSLTLAPGNERSALKLALVKTALGKLRDARTLLDDHRSVIAPADYGLALALAGDAEGAVRALEPAARQEGATAKTRQNLALAYALAGRWLDARAVVSQDLPFNMVDKRIVEWASFARPVAQWEQVASLLGVTPASDAGQPVALALAQPSQTIQLAQIAPEPAPPMAPEPEIAAVAPEAPANPEPSFEVASAEPVPTPAAPVEVAAAPEAAPLAVPAVIFAPLSPIVQPIPEAKVAQAPVIRSAPGPVKQAVVPASTAVAAKAVKPVESGRFVVQLGAFRTAANADAAWHSAAKRIAGLDAYDARQSRIKVRAGSFYRLSVSGFVTREDAGRVCTQVKSSGGVCFIRNLTSNETIRFAARTPSGEGTQLASRN